MSDIENFRASLNNISRITRELKEQEQQPRKDLRRIAENSSDINNNVEALKADIASIKERVKTIETDSKENIAQIAALNEIVKNLRIQLADEQETARKDLELERKRAQKAEFNSRIFTICTGLLSILIAYAMPYFIAALSDFGAWLSSIT